MIDDAHSVFVRELYEGLDGTDVFMLQNGLIDKGYDCGVPDGVYNAQTVLAVNELKEANGLATDGVADADVWQILLQWC